MIGISVVIPCYNATRDVGEAIESILNQTAYDRIAEIIVVDDGSTDGSREVIERYQDRSEEVQYVYQENQGPSVARNTGIRKSTQEYIAFLDADDLWLPEKIEKQAAFLEKHPEVGLLCTDAFVKELSGRKHRVVCNNFDCRSKSDNLRMLFTKGGPILMPTVLAKAACFAELGEFDESLLIGQDTDMWLRIAAEYPIHRLGFPSILVRRRSDSVSFSKERKAAYLHRVTNKMAERYPRLGNLKKKRTAMIESRLGVYFLLKEKRKEALQASLRAIQNDLSSLRSYIVLVLSLLPFGEKIARGMMAVRQTVRTMLR